MTLLRSDRSALERSVNPDALHASETDWRTAVVCRSITSATMAGDGGMGAAKLYVVRAGVTTATSTAGFVSLVESDSSLLRVISINHKIKKRTRLRIGANNERSVNLFLHPGLSPESRRALGRLVARGSGFLLRLSLHGRGKTRWLRETPIVIVELGFVPED